MNSFCTAKSWSPQQHEHTCTTRYAWPPHLQAFSVPPRPYRLPCRSWISWLSSCLSLCSSRWKPRRERETDRPSRSSVSVCVTVSVHIQAAAAERACDPGFMSSRCLSASETPGRQKLFLTLPGTEATPPGVRPIGALSWSESSSLTHASGVSGERLPAGGSQNNI